MDVDDQKNTYTEMEKKNNSLLEDHITYLEKHYPSPKVIFKRRLQCVADYVACFNSKLEELNITHLFPDNVQWFTYWLCDDGKKQLEEHFKRKKIKRKPESLLFEFVRPLISPERDYYGFKDSSGNAQKAFYELREGKWVQRVYFIPKIDKTATYYSAAATIFGKTTKKGDRWLSELFLVKKVLVHYKNRKSNPLLIGEELHFENGYLPNNDEPSSFGIKYFEGSGDKIIFGIELKEYEPYLKIMADKLQVSKFKYKPDAVELMNIMIILILMEHELVHIWVSICDKIKGDSVKTSSLATPKDYKRIYKPKKKITPVPIYNAEGEEIDDGKKHAKDNNKRLKNNKWPLLDKEEQRCLNKKDGTDTGFCYTDTSGHQSEFCKLTHLIFGHIGQTTCTSKFIRKGTKKNNKKN
tara:strand:- start:112 stop:1344 length:1233 start_codon:yes stop_codon:yes gene_type:complete